MLQMGTEIMIKNLITARLSIYVCSLTKKTYNSSGLPKCYTTSAISPGEFTHSATSNSAGSLSMEASWSRSTSSSLEEDLYQPTREDTKEAYEALLCIIEHQVGGTSGHIDHFVAEEILSILKSQIVTDPFFQKFEIEKLLNHMEKATFDQLLSIAGVITDYPKAYEAFSVLEEGLELYSEEQRNALKLIASVIERNHAPLPYAVKWKVADDIISIIRDEGMSFNAKKKTIEKHLGCISWSTFDLLVSIGESNSGNCEYKCESGLPNSSPAVPENASSTITSLESSDISRRADTSWSLCQYQNLRELQCSTTSAKANGTKEKPSCDEECSFSLRNGSYCHEKEVVELEDHDHYDVQWPWDTDTYEVATQERASAMLMVAGPEKMKPMSEEKVGVTNESGSFELNDKAGGNMSTSDSNHDQLLKEIKDCLKKEVTADELRSLLGTRDGSPSAVMNALIEALFGGGIRSISMQVTKMKNCLAAVSQSKGSQLLLLQAIESYYGKSSSEVEDVALVIKVLYDADVLEEEYILKWYQEGVVGANKSCATWKNVRPLIEWLETAESKTGEE